MSANIYPTPNGTYRVKWRENGKPLSKTLKTEVEAIQYAAKVDTAMARGRSVMRRKDVPDVKTFALDSLAKWTHLEPFTVRLYVTRLKKHVFPQIGHLNLLDCSPIRMDEWQSERIAAGAGGRSLGQTQAILHKMFARAVRLHYLDQNPMTGMTRPEVQHRETRWLTANEVEKLRQWYIERKDYGSATLISILGYVGIRPQDALALETHHVGDRLQVVQRVSAGQIQPGAKTGKHKVRAVYLPEPVAVDIDNWLLHRTVESKLLFPRATDGGPWTKTNIDNWRQRPIRKNAAGKEVRQKCFKTAAHDCGLGETLTPYGLRHTAATLYAASGWNHIEIAHQLGHSPAESMKTYQHLIEAAQGQPRVPVDDWINSARGIPSLTSKEEAAR